MLKVVLMVGEIVKTTASFKIPVSALVTKGEKAIQGLMVQFYLGVQKSGAAVETDVNGRAVYEFDGIPLTEKEVMLQAQVDGTSAWARVVILLPAEPKAVRVLTCSEPQVFGDNGTYEVRVRVTDERHNGVQGIKFIFRDLIDPNGTKDERTNQDGICFVKVQFQEIDKFVVVEYPDGTDRKLHLFGPIPSRLIHVNP